MIVEIKNLKELKSFAHKFLEGIKPQKAEATVVALSGDLGSGKTAFVKSAAEYFGVKESVTSPTFVIMKLYPLNANRFTLLIHIDAYRLEKEIELEKLGWKKLMEDPGNIIFIEWPEHVVGLLPRDTKKFSFLFIDETTRQIEI